MSYPNYHQSGKNPPYPQQFPPVDANSGPLPQQSQTPYPTQPYPGFMGSYYSVNQSSDSIGQRINNRQDRYNKYGNLAQQAHPPGNQQRLDSISSFESQIPRAPLENQPKKHSIHSSTSVTSGSTYNSNSEPNTLSDDPAYQQAFQKVASQAPQHPGNQRLRCNDDLSDGFSKMNLQQQPQQGQYQMAPQQYSQHPPQHQQPQYHQQKQGPPPPLQHQQYQKHQEHQQHQQQQHQQHQQHQQSYPQPQSQSRSQPQPQQQQPVEQPQLPPKVANFIKQKTEAVSDYQKNGQFSAKIQLDWVKALFEYTMDHEFMRTYNINGEYLGRELSSNEVKKNEQVFITQAVKLLKKICTEKKYSEAEFILGSLYSNSPVIKVPRTNILEKNYDKSFDYYAKAARNQHPVALYRLAVSHELGIGCSGNDEKAFECFKDSANLGWVPSMFKLGVLYSRGGLKLPRSAKDSMAWFSKAAEQSSEENPHALFEIARIYERDFPWLKTQTLTKSDIDYLHELDRLGLLQDDSKALYYYKEAARFKYPPAQCKLGWCYEYGKLGCLIDPKKSIGWYSRSAKQGYAIAEMALSGWYLTGAKGILEPNDKEAYLWASKAAQSGFVKAEYALGYYHEVGLGCEKDTEKSRKFYLRAATQGHEKAIQKLKGSR